MTKIFLIASQSPYILNVILIVILILFWIILSNNLRSIYVNKHDTKYFKIDFLSWKDWRNVIFFHMWCRANILNIHIEWENINRLEKARNISPGDSTAAQSNRYHYKIVAGSCVETETVNMYNVWCHMSAKRWPLIIKKGVNCYRD